jgi:hypothetical protein
VLSGSKTDLQKVQNIPDGKGKIVASDSDIDEQDQMFKQHVKSIKLKEAFKAQSDSEWKKLCIANFDFVSTQITSNKNKNASAADLAEQHDRDTINMMF